MDEGRYLAQPTEHQDRLGLPTFAVIDRRTGAVEETYDGYFAGQDARALADRLNQDPEDKHE
jgi:hypothetical protein